MAACGGRPRAFPRSCRIRTRQEYDRTFREGRSRHSAHFRLVAARGRATTSRLGLVVSRKVGKAHDRNRIKRLVREYFRTRMRAGSDCVDLVVVAKAGAAALDLAGVSQELEGLLGVLLRELRSER